MKLQYASDLHIEFDENKEYLMTHQLDPRGDILILAGDIVPVSQTDKHKDFFDYISKHFKFTYWLPGNHEYYYSDISKKGGSLNDKIRNNVRLVNNISITCENINLIFSTLWTRLSRVNEFEMLVRYSDFHAIKSKGRSFRLEEYNDMHERCLKYIKKELTCKKAGRSIVVTHHMPTFFNYPEEYREDPMSEAFAVELSDLIRASGPDYWIFGHHHTNKGDFKIGKTRLLTNQLGYVIYNEHEEFDPSRLLEI